MSRVRANLVLLLAGAIWGMGFVAQSTAMDDIGPFLFVSTRHLVAAVVVAPFAWSETKRRRTAASQSEFGPVPWRPFLLIGGVLFVAMSLQQIGLQTTTVTNSGFLTGLYVVFTPLLGIALFRQWPHPVVWPAAIVAVVGIAMLSGGSVGGWAAGDNWTVLSALGWGFHVTLIGRVVGPSGRPLTMAFVQFAVTAALAGLVAVAVESVDVAALGRAAAEIVYAGTLASGLAFSLQAVGQRYTTAPQAAIFLSSEAPFAAMFGALVLSERIGLVGGIGCCFIFAAMLAVELVPNRRSGRNETPDVELDVVGR